MSAAVRMARRFDWQVAVIALFIGIGNGMLHWQAVDRPWRDYQTEVHLRMIAGTFVSPDQYRPLTFYLAEGLVRLGLPIHSAHEVWRVLFTSAALYVFYRYARGWFTPLIALLGTFILAAAIPLTYVYYMMTVTDPLNMLVFFLAFWAMRDGRTRLLFPLVGIGMLNREAALLIPLFYAATRWGRPWREWLPTAAGTALLAFALYIGLRVIIGPKPACCTDGPIEHLITNFTDWRAYVDALGVLSVTLWGAWLGWQRRPLFLRRLSLVIPLFLVPHLLYGPLREARYYLPLLGILIPMALFYLQEQVRQELEPSADSVPLPRPPGQRAPTATELAAAALSTGQPASSAGR